MSFQRITTIGSMPVSNSDASASRRDAVALVLEPVDLDGVVVDVLEAAQPRHRLGDLAARTARSTCGQLLGLLHRRLDLVEAEEVGDLLDVVDDVVERGGERVDVLAVDRRDERLVQAVDDVVRDAVALLLADQDRRARARRGRGSR